MSPDRPTGRLRAGQLAWLSVLILTGAVQLVRAQWFDATLFLGAAVVLGIDAWRGSVHSAARDRPRNVLRSPWSLAAAGGAAITLSVVPRHSVAMQVAVGAVGACAVVIAWRGSRPAPHRWSPELRRLGWTWGTILVVGCLWELGQFLAGKLRPSEPAFALSDLVDPLLAWGVGQWLFAAGWIGLGVFLLRRIPTWR